MLELAQRIDETRLTFQPEEDPVAVIEALCRNALEVQFRAVCVRPQYVALAKSILNGSSVRVATVIAFPLDKAPLKTASFGDMSWQDKMAEIRKALLDGADELDIVMNVPWFKSHAVESSVEELIRFEILHLLEAAQNKAIKLIIETDLLTPEEIIKATQMACLAGVAYVKTSTGMLIGGHGATVENIRLIRSAINKPQVGIKASGGIRTAEQAMALLEAGADILGCSNGKALLDDFSMISK